MLGISCQTSSNQGGVMRGISRRTSSYRSVPWVATVCSRPHICAWHNPRDDPHHPGAPVSPVSPVTGSSQPRRQRKWCGQWSPPGHG